MSFANRAAVESHDGFARVIRLRLCCEVVLNILPGVAPLIICAQSPARVVAAVDHAILASGITGYAIDYAIFVPIHLIKHLLVTGKMAVGHQIAGRLPSFDVAGGDGPGGAGQLAFAGEKFLVNWSAENGKPFAPLLDLEIGRAHV